MTTRTIKTIIAEDNMENRQFLKSILGQHKDFQVIGEAGNGKELVSMIFKLHQKPQVIFIDIEMPELDGMTAAKKILSRDEDMLVVFVTAHAGFAVDAFDIASFDYILKPYNEARVEKALDKIRARLAEKDRDLKKLTTIMKSSDMLFFKSGHELHFLDPNNIYFIEKDGKKTVIHTTDNRYDTHESINDIEKRLDPVYFFRSHKCYLVNLKKVEKIVPWGENTHLVKFIGSRKDAIISRSKVKMLYDLLLSSSEQ